MDQTDKRVLSIIVSGFLIFAHIIAVSIWYEDKNPDAFVYTLFWDAGVLVFIGLVKLVFKIFPKDKK